MASISNLLLYNSIKNEKEILKPITPNQVTLYVCGPTLYDELHIGNIRPLIVFDVLFRLLKIKYKEVIYVRNVTDIDDKIIKKAQTLNISTIDIVSQQNIIYKEILSSLNILPPTYEPYATDHINNMIDMITLLLNKGYAYVKNRHVFFNITKFKEYGTLSKRTDSNTVLGLGNDSIVKDIKENYKDFVLWKPSKIDEPFWDSPFGKGRPGWHIECSAMSYEYLGSTFDIHGGGSDLLFPHHENERAQTMAAYGCSHTANIWMHNAFINMNNFKMSKSLGNVITGTEIIKEFHGEVLRLSILLTHYRHPINFTKNILAVAKNILDKMYNTLRLAKDINNCNKILNEKELILNEVLILKQAFLKALLDDLNTPLAITEMQKIVLLINKANKEHLKQELVSLLHYCASFLGVLQIDPEVWFTDNIEFSKEDIDNMLKIRMEAKKQKKYSLADSIRDDLLKKGIILEDNKNTTTWRKL